MRSLSFLFLIFFTNCASNKAVVKKAIAQNIIWDKNFAKIELPLITQSDEYATIQYYLIDSGYISHASENQKVNKIVVETYEVTDKAKPFLDTAFFVPGKNGEYVALFNFFKIKKWSISRFSFSNNKDTLRASLNVVYDYTAIFPKKEPEKNIACVFVKNSEEWALQNIEKVFADIYVDPGPDYYFLLKKKFAPLYETWRKDLRNKQLEKLNIK